MAREKEKGYVIKGIRDSLFGQINYVFQYYQEDKNGELNRLPPGSEITNNILCKLPNKLESYLVDDTNIIVQEIIMKVTLPKSSPNKL